MSYDRMPEKRAKKREMDSCRLYTLIETGIGRYSPAPWPWKAAIRQDSMFIAMYDHLDTDGGHNVLEIRCKFG